jgi:hypothetical protein
MRCGYLPAFAGSSGTHNANVTLSASVGGAGQAFAVALAGHDPADFFEHSASVNGTAANSGGGATITCAAAGCAIFALDANTGSDSTAGACCTLIAMSNVAYENGGEYNLSGSSGGNTVAFTHSSGAYLMAAYAFNQAGGGGGSIIPIIMNHRQQQAQ